MAKIRDLPSEIIRAVFGFTEKATLINIALASRTMNELACLSLYVSVNFNRPYRLHRYGVVEYYNPFEAFERRPILRNVVREVFLYGK